MSKNTISKYIIILSVILGIVSGILGGYFYNIYILGSNNLNTKNTATSIKSLESNITSLVKKVSPSVVSIIIKKDLPAYQNDPFGFFSKKVGSVEKEIGGGTGFFINKNGTIITNKHVISDKLASYSIVLNNGEIYDAEIIALDKVNDLGILKINYDSIPLKIISKNNNLQIGQFIIAIGNALSEFQNSVSFGVISGKNRIINTDGQTLSSLIQTDTAINPGNSGGPLINLNGEIIGINTAIASGQGLGFSIKLSEEKIKYILNSIDKYGEIKKPFIGIYFLAINQSIAEELGVEYDYGIYIPNKKDSIVKGSAADLAGLKPGNIILSIDGEKITSKYTMDIILQNKFPSEKLKLEIIDNNLQKKNIELILGKN